MIIVLFCFLYSKGNLKIILILLLLIILLWVFYKFGFKFRVVFVLYRGKKFFDFEVFFFLCVFSIVIIVLGFMY